MPASRRLSVVIPAYNEAQRIAATLDRVIAYLRSENYLAEIIVVDDGSTDATAQITATFNGHSGIPVRIFRNRMNRGKGGAVRRGAAAAQGEFIIFTDADLSTPIETLGEFMPRLMASAQVVIGSRALPESQVMLRQPWYRETMGKVFNIWVQGLTLPGVHDSQCGFKAFTREAGRKIFARQTILGFGFDAEILFIARRLGYSITELPVRWHNSLGSKISPIRDSWTMFWDLFRIRLRHPKSKYSPAALVKVSGCRIRQS
jgi:dolichyl-phosphate beta-glucosyltransferase